jgi:hypothetical protein
MLRIYFVFINDNDTVTHTLRETLPLQQTILRKDLVELIKPKLKQELQHYKLAALLRYQVDLLLEEVEDFVCELDSNDDSESDDGKSTTSTSTSSTSSIDDDDYYIRRFLKKEKQLTDLHFPSPCDKVFNDLLTLWVILKEEPINLKPHVQSRKKHHLQQNISHKQTRRRH